MSAIGVNARHTISERGPEQGILEHPHRNRRCGLQFRQSGGIDVERNIRRVRELVHDAVIALAQYR